VASNLNTPSDLLRELAKEYPGAVSGNPNTPPDLLLELAKEVPAVVARNPNTPPDVLRELMNHHRPLVRDGAKANLSSRGLL